MPDVARAAGVSLKTVSRVINNEPHVSPKTEAQVREVVARLGFRRNHIARSLRSSQTSASIGLVIGDLANPFFSTIARAAEIVAEPRHFMLVAGSSDEDPERERELVSSLCQRRVDGLLIVPAGKDHEYLVPELEMGTPMVFLDRPPVGIKVDSVVLDNRRGARRGVEHLLARGHRRVAMVSDSSSIFTMAERLRGYRAALVAAGIEEDASIVRIGPHRPEEAEAAAHELLDLPDPPTAFFAGNNRATVGIIRALWERGQEVDVVGVDDFELADMLPLPFVVVSHDPAEMGRVATELLFRRLDGDNTPPQKIVLPTELVARGSRGGGAPS